MNKLIVFSILFFGLLVSTNGTNAVVSKVNIFKNMTTLHNSPWDPRGDEDQEQDQEPDQDAGKSINE